MRTGRAVLGSAAFAAAAPGTMVVLVPWLLTRWHSSHPSGPSIALGVVLLGAGAIAGLHTTASFVREGRGTPAPNAPPEQLVVGGLYRHVRNPMYLAVIAAVVGEALVLGRGVLLVWATSFWIVVHLWVLAYEEPVLTRRFGDPYLLYRHHVRRWVPRFTPWPTDQAGGRSRG
jgi:protein-S-isoprenylcysteine O-methyltransferase Ste14